MTRHQKDISEKCEYISTTGFQSANANLKSCPAFTQKSGLEIIIVNNSGTKRGVL